MKKSVLLIVVMILALLLVHTATYAQSKAGTSAAPELLIPVGARNVAMSGAAVSSINGVEAIFWNPAGLDATSSTSSAMFSHRSYIADMGVNYIAVASKFSSLGSIGITLRTFNIGQINVTTENDPDGNGEVINPTFFTLGATYSKLLTDHVSIGATVNVVNESFGSVSASGVAFDAGVQYRNLGGLQGLSLGVSMNNIGTSMKYEGSGLWVQADAQNSDRGLSYYKVEAASFQMPSIIQIGLGYKLELDESNSLLLSGAFENNNFGIDEYRAGGEYSFMKVLALRAGYQYSTDPSGTKSIFQNMTLGIGLDLKELGLPIALDYAYAPVQYFSANHLFDIHLEF